MSRTDDLRRDRPQGVSHIRPAPLFQTDDERYAWLTDVQAVATESAATGAVVCEVYKLL